MTRTLRALFAAVLTTALLTAIPASPAGAGATAASDFVDSLEDVTSGLDDVTRLTKRLTRPRWDPAVARAVRLAGIDRLEQAIAAARVEAMEAVEHLVGADLAATVPAAITAALWTDTPDDVWRREVATVIGAWQEHRRSVQRAEQLRNRLRSSLGLPLPDGIRVCPFEQAVVLDEDWGDPRGWRSHKGNDINAPEGTRLVAMERGEVIQMGSHYLGGDGLYLRGDITGDVYYYAHLSGYAEGIEVGTPVIAGQVVAYVGMTGNADVPHLHLGWMPAAGGVDLDALTDAHELLRGLCG